MRLRRKSLAFIFGLLSFCSPVLGQEDNEDQFKYCIAVKQTFDSWGDCSHGKPQFDEASVELQFGNNSSLKKTITKAQLGVPIEFSEIFKGTSEFNKVSLSLNQNDESKQVKKIVVNTVATGIKNDTKLNYEASPKDWRVGVNEPLSQSASDPCSNNANWSRNREGYTMFTTVIIDDPVMIAGLQQEPYDAESEYIVLGFDNGWDIDKVSYNVNGGYIGLDKRKDKRKEQFTRLSTQVFNLSDCKK